MMNQLSAACLIAFTLAVLALSSCRKEIQDNTVKNAHLQDKRVEILSHRLKLPVTSLKPIDNGVFLGDVYYDNDYIDKLQEKGYLFYQAPLVSAQNLPNIRIYFQQPLDASWVTATNQAISEINSIPNCKVNIATTSSSSTGPNVIKFYTWSGTVTLGLDDSYGGAGPPSLTGNVGSSMFVYNNGTGIYSNWSPETKSTSWPI